MPATHRALASVFAVLSVAIFAFGGGARAATAQPTQQNPLPPSGGLDVSAGAGTLADGLTAAGHLVIVVENSSTVPAITRLSSQFSGIGPTVCLQPGDRVTFTITDPNWIAYWIDNGVQIYGETEPYTNEWPDCGVAPAPPPDDPDHDFGTIGWAVSCDPTIQRTTPCQTETTIEDGTPAPFPWIVAAQVTPGQGGGTTTTTSTTSTTNPSTTSTTVAGTTSTTVASSSTTSTTPSSSTTTVQQPTTTAASSGPVVLPTVTTTTQPPSTTSTFEVQVSPATAFLPATGRDPLVLVASATMLLASGITLLTGQRRALATIAIRSARRRG